MPVTTANIDQYRTNADNLAQSATSFASAQPTVQGELRDALASKFTEFKQPIEQKNQAMADYLSSGANARSEYGDPNSQNFVFNPYDRAKLVANAQSQAYQPYGALSDYINLAMGTVKDLASQGAGMYQAEATNRLGQATNAQNQYTNALNEYAKMQDLDIARQKQASSSAVSPYSKILEQYMTQLFGGGNSGSSATGSSNYGEEPNYSPLSNGERVVNNEGIVWEFQDTKWIPVGSI